jgi:hypothetical protein
VLVKAAFDPGFGHYEIFGIAGFAHETVYPGETTNSNLYGGLKDITTGALVAPALTTAGSTSPTASSSVASAAACVSRDRQQAHLGRQGPLRTRRGPLRQHHLSDVTANAVGRTCAHPQPIGPG